MQPVSARAFVRKPQKRLMMSRSVPADATPRGLAEARPPADATEVVNAKASRRKTSVRRAEKMGMTRLLGERSVAAPMAAGAALPEKETGSL